MNRVKAVKTLQALCCKRFVRLQDVIEFVFLTALYLCYPRV